MKKFITPLLVLLGALVLISAPLVSAKTSQADRSDTYKQLNLLMDVFENIRAEYVLEVSDEDLIKGAINGMLASLDPHSVYLTKDRFADRRVQIKGEYGGLGMEVTLDRGVVLVVSPIDDTPASRAGIQPGDYITKLDGEQITGLTLNEAVSKMKGKVGTDILVTVVRKGEKNPLDIKLTRDTIVIKSVRYHLEGEFGYVRIASFTQNTQSGLDDALKNIKAELGDNLKGIILDLRNNPGGLLNQSISVSDTFLERGEVVSTRPRNDEKIRRFLAKKGDKIDGKPMIVLVNGGTASASEIVAGALQDHRRALVVGTQSFGKGLVQTEFAMGNQGAIYLTTAYYFTPSGNSIQGEGITPDVIVEQIKFDKTEQVNTRQRTEASLRNSLANPNGKSEDKADAKGDDAKGEDAGKPKKEEARKLTTAREDFQLNYAINLLRGMALTSKAN